MFSDTDNKFLGASGQSVSSGTDPTSFYIQNTWTRPLTDQEKDEYWCFLNSADFGKFTGAADWLISFLPSSPESARIPNQITKLTGDGTLASNLLLEF